MLLGPRQYWLPAPRPFSELIPTRFACDTWIDGSPAWLPPQPVAPTIATCGEPVANVDMVASAPLVIAAARTVAAPSAAQPRNLLRPSHMAIASSRENAVCASG